MRLAELGPLSLALAGRANTRRATLEAYFEANRIEVARIVELDAMLATLDLVARTSWTTILPAIIMAEQPEPRQFTVNPLADPPLHAELVLIEPSRKALSPAAGLFLTELERETRRLNEDWTKTDRRHRGRDPSHTVIMNHDRHLANSIIFDPATEELTSLAATAAELAMDVAFCTMPIHPLGKDWRVSLREDREAFILADELGFTEGYVGEHITDQAETITSCAVFIASLIEATKTIKLGTGTVNLPNAHPAAVAAQIAMLDHLLDGRFLFGISPGGLLSDAEVFGNLDADRNAMFVEAIDQILAIWSGEAPYNINGRYWSISTEQTLFAEIGQGIIARPLQRPHPPSSSPRSRPSPRASRKRRCEDGSRSRRTS